MQHFILPACVIQGLVSFVFPVTFVFLLSQIPHNSGSTGLASSSLVLLYLFLLKYIISVIFKYLEYGQDAGACAQFSALLHTAL